MEKVIKFEKWIDPFNKQEDLGYKDSYEKIESGGSPYENKYSGPIIVGPIGPIPINEDAIPSKIYNFWMFHTNFEIDSDIIDKIEGVPGVETLDIFTRYRGRISFGKVFNENEVKNCIKEKLTTLNVVPKSGGDEKLKASLDKKYKFWAILINSEGKRKILSGDTQGQVKDQIESENYEKAYFSWEERI